MRKIFIVIIVLGLSACGSGNQKRAIDYDKMQQVVNEADSCTKLIDNNPEYADIIAHWDKMTDNSYPSIEERKMMLRYHNESLPCMKTMLIKMEDIDPPLPYAVLKEYVKSKEISLQMLKGKLTWGEYNSEKQDLKTQSKLNIRKLNNAGSGYYDDDPEQRKFIDETIPKLVPWTDEMIGSPQ